MKRNASHAAGCVHPRQTVYEAARTLLTPLLDRILRTCQGACAGDDPEYLHDLRIALRRFRTAVRLLRAWLPPEGSEGIDAELRWLNRRLGAVRDTDVWLDFCRQVPPASQASAWSRYLAKLAAGRVGRLTRLRRILQAGRTTVLLDRLRQIVTVDLPALERRGDPVPVSLFAACTLSRFFLRLERRCAWSEDPSPAAFHAARRFFRRERYIAEFLMPGCVAVAGDFGARLKALSADLGTVHDMDRAAARIAEEHLVPPPALRKMIATRRGEALARFEAGWQELCNRWYRRRFFRKLKRGGA